MQSYYISGSNLFTIRTKPTGSGVLTLRLQNMYTLANTSSSISASGRPYTYQPYESILNWTASISQAIIGEQYRAYITDGTSSIWHGSISVFASQSIDKPSTVSQLGVEEVFKSNVTDNEYIIM